MSRKTAYSLGDRFKIDPSWQRTDCPPNANGHRYTEYRNSRGECVAVFLSSLLAEI